jgi:hypothetical protein
MRGVFAAGEPSGQRWELALDLLRRGGPISLGPVTLRPIETSLIRVEIDRSSRPLTADRARADFQEAKGWVEDLYTSDAAFREALGSSELDYVLVEDLDMGYIILCRLTSTGDLEWLVSEPW